MPSLASSFQGACRQEVKQSGCWCTVAAVAAIEFPENHFVKDLTFEFSIMEDVHTKKKMVADHTIAFYILTHTPTPTHPPTHPHTHLHPHTHIHPRTQLRPSPVTRGRAGKVRATKSRQEPLCAGTVTLYADVLCF